MRVPFTIYAEALLPLVQIWVDVGYSFSIEAMSIKFSHHLVLWFVIKALVKSIKTATNYLIYSSNLLKAY